MKNLMTARPNNNIIENFEVLTVNEMYIIRGGAEGETTKTKEIDIYDTRED